MLRKIYFILLTGCCMSFSLSSVLVAGDFKSPHIFKAGDVLSSDVLNELFSYIEQTQRDISMSDIVGDWECKKIIAGDMYPAMVNDHYTTVDVDGLWHSVDVPVTFIDDGDGTYSWSSIGINAFSIGGADPRDVCNGSGKVSLYHRSFAITYTTCDSSYSGLYEYKTTMHSNTNIEIRQMMENTANTRLICDKTNIPPEIPEESTISIFGNSITLTWTDRSEDETGFAIIRRDKLDGQWAEIATVDPVTGTGSIVTYTNAGLSSGAYWYRVKAVNGYGKSLGSNVSKVEIP